MKKFRPSWAKLFIIIIIVIAASAMSHVGDKWTVPLQNDTTLAQMNGGDIEMVAMHSTNSFLTSVRDYIWPTSLFLCFIIFACEGVRAFKFFTEEEKTTNQNKNPKED